MKRPLFPIKSEWGSVPIFASQLVVKDCNFFFVRLSTRGAFNTSQVLEQGYCEEGNMFIAVFLFFVGLWQRSFVHGGGTCLASCPVKAGVGDYSYDPSSQGGPRGWGGITGYETCGRGEIQSPIDFPLAALQAVSLSDGPQPHMKPAGFVFKTGVENWALQCAEPKTCGHTLLDGGKRFDVFNLHFHAPAEHTKRGVTYPLEAHVVHSSDDGRLAVIAILFDFPRPGKTRNSSKSKAAEVAEAADSATAIDAGDDDALVQGHNAFMQGVLEHVERDESTFEVDLSDVVDLSDGVCSYSGSLTTPPCTEGVMFYMQNKILSISKLQVHKYRLATGFSIHGNNRPLQPLNSRNITCFA